jgi:hypothetical protein
VCVAGFFSGLVLLALGAALPARIQTGFLYTGIGLALLSVAAGLAPAGDARLRWIGMSPALGIVLGVMAGASPLILSGSWFGAEDKMGAPSAPASNPRGTSWVGAWFHSDSRSAASTPSGLRAPAPAPPAELPSADEESAGRALEPGLAQAADILEQRAKPLLAEQQRFLLAATKDRSAARGVKAQLESNARELADIQSSLARITSDNRNSGSDLNSVTGAASVIGRLSSSLRVFNESLQSDGPRGDEVRLRQLAYQTALANQFIDQRLAGARAEMRTASR